MLGLRTTRVILLLSLTAFTCQCSLNKDKVVKQPKVPREVFPQGDLKLYSGKLREDIDRVAMHKYVEETEFKTDFDGNIVILFLESFRRDYVDKYAVNLRTHRDLAFTGKSSVSGASATMHSTFNVFHSLPATLAHKEFENKKTTKGSLPLMIFKKLGYQIHLYGLYFYCLKNQAPPGGWDATLESYFGFQSSLIDACNDHKEINQLVRERGTQKYNDDIIVDDVIAKMTANKDHKSIYIVYLYSAHSPFLWRKDLKDPLKPNHFGVGTGRAHTWNQSNITHLQEEENQVLLQNSYANSIKSIDFEIGRLFQAMKELKIYDESSLTS